MSRNRTSKKRRDPAVALVLGELKARAWTWERLAYESGLSYRTVEELLRPTGAGKMTRATAVGIATAFGWPWQRLAPVADNGKPKTE